MSYDLGVSYPDLVGFHRTNCVVLTILDLPGVENASCPDPWMTPMERIEPSDQSLTNHIEVFDPEDMVILAI